MQGYHLYNSPMEIIELSEDPVMAGNIVKARKISGEKIGIEMGAVALTLLFIAVGLMIYGMVRSAPAHNQNIVTGPDFSHMDLAFLDMLDCSAGDQVKRLDAYHWNGFWFYDVTYTPDAGGEELRRVYYGASLISGYLIPDEVASRLKESGTIGSDEYVETVQYYSAFLAAQAGGVHETYDREKLQSLFEEWEEQKEEQRRQVT